MVNLTNVLGYDDGFNLYGTSYGTRLALNAMRSTPQNIRIVVADGTSPPLIPNVAYTFAKQFEQYKSIFAQCAADEACNAAYPDLEARFVALLAELESNLIPFDPPLKTGYYLRREIGESIDSLCTA